MTPIDYDAEIEMFMKALTAYGIACAGDHTAAQSHLKECGAQFEPGRAADKTASGILIGLYARALLQLCEAQAPRDMAAAL